MRNNKSLLSLILCVALLLTSIASLTAVPAGAAQTAAAPTAADVKTASTAADVDTADTSADITKSSTGSSGSEQVILHCWNWPFSKIISELDNTRRQATQPSRPVLSQALSAKARQLSASGISSISPRATKSATSSVQRMSSRISAPQPRTRAFT